MSEAKKQFRKFAKRSLWWARQFRQAGDSGLAEKAFKSFIMWRALAARTV